MTSLAANILYKFYWEFCLRFLSSWATITGGILGFNNKHYVFSPTTQKRNTNSKFEPVVRNFWTINPALYLLNYHCRFFWFQFWLNGGRPFETFMCQWNLSFWVSMVGKCFVSITLEEHQGPHDRKFLARINYENFLRGATERNTR